MTAAGTYAPLLAELRATYTGKHFRSAPRVEQEKEIGYGINPVE